MFNDKHLSWNWEWAREMYDTSRRMGFPLMVGYGGSDVMDFHALEALQCMVERRKGGETGVAASR